MKRIVFILGVILVLLGILFIPAFLSTQQTNAHKLKVSASFYPLYYFASEIGGEKAHVTSITPAGVEPHDYDPTPKDIARIQGSKLVIINGSGFEPWFHKLEGDLQDVVVVTATDGLNLHNTESEHSGEGENHAGEMSAKDPHVWLDPVLAKQEVQNITKGFVTVDPENASYYQDNEEKLLSKLDDLNQRYEVGLENCRTRDFVTSHTAFSYLAHRYNLTQVSIAGLSPDQEPSSQQLAAVADFAKKNNIKYIFFESLVSPRLSETIAREVGAKTLVLDPLEGLSDDKVKQGQNYFTVMENNLQNLRLALQCK